MVYFCEACNFNTKIKTHFEKHLKTSKHLRKIETTPESIPEESIPEESTPEESISEYEDSDEYSIPYISIIYNELFKIKSSARNKFEFVRNYERVKRQYIDRCREMQEEKWDSNNSHVDMGFQYSKWRARMTYIMVDIRDHRVYTVN